MAELTAQTIVIRGAGSIATGIAVRLLRAGFWRICLLEREYPLSVHRMASFSETVLEGYATVEGITAVLVAHPRELPALWKESCVGVIVDPTGMSLRDIRPDVCVDTLGAHVDGHVCTKPVHFSLHDAPLVIGVGTGYTLGKDAHVLIEAFCPGIGRVVRTDRACSVCARRDPHNGMPEVCVLAPQGGVFRTDLEIGQEVEAGAIIGEVHQPGLWATQGLLVHAPVPGILRGLLRDYTPIEANVRLANLVPSYNELSCCRVSDRALAVGGGVLEAICAAFSPRREVGGVLQG